MSFDLDETSSARSRPIDLYTIATPTSTYHLTSHVTDVEFGGVTFFADTVSRGSIQLAQDLTGREVVVYLPISHPFVQGYAAIGVPEHQVVVTLQRLQTTGTARTQWTGFGTGLSIDGDLALLRVPSLTDDALKIRLPVIATTKTCNHVLYDPRCTLPIEGRTFLAIVSAISSDGLTITTDQVADATTWLFGIATDTTTGERRLIVSQSGDGSVITVDVPFRVLRAPGRISMTVGCDHTVNTCRDTFHNVVNFGGHPQMNAAFNPWLPKGLGVTQQA